MLMDDSLFVAAPPIPCPAITTQTIALVNVAEVANNNCADTMKPIQPQSVRVESEPSGKVREKQDDYTYMSESGFKIKVTEFKGEESKLRNE